jgi:adhesin/invasin
LSTVAGVVLGITTLSAGAAVAYIATSTTDSSHPAQALAATLAAPGAGHQDGQDKAGAVAITWTAPAGYTPGGYQVFRCTGTSCTPTTQIGSRGCSGTLNKTSCTDNDPTLAVGQTYTYEVKALLDNWTSPADTPFRGTTAGATTMTFTTQPSSGQQIQATGTGTFDVTVTVQDANGSTATTDSTDTVTLAIDGSHDPSHGKAALTCTGGLTVGVNKGVATFKKCAIDKVGPGYQLTASSSNSALAALGNANSFSIVAGKPSQFTATSGGGQSANTSAPFANPLVATLQDSDGNPVSGAAVTFTAPANGASTTFASTGCASQPSASSCVVLTDNNGVATSSAFAATAKAGNYTISATTPGVTKVTFAESDAAYTTVSSVVTADGSGTSGQLGNGDMITVKFNGPIDPSTVCSAWANGSPSIQTAAEGSVITVDGTGLLKFTTAPTVCGTFRFANVGLGSTGYYTPSNGSKLTFAGSAIAYDPANNTLTVTLGAMSGAGTVNKVTAGSAVQLNLSTGILDAGDNALTGYTFTTAPGVQF